MLARVERSLEQSQARRLGVSAAWFHNRTLNEWWITGQDAIRHRCADALVHVECTPSLARRNVSLHTAAPQQKPLLQTFSACPLVTSPRAAVYLY